MPGMNKEFLQRNVALRMRRDVAAAASFAQVGSYKVGRRSVGESLRLDRSPVGRIKHRYCSC